jgi:hypothetical protein
MPDAGDEKVADLAADHQPDVVGGDDGTDQRAADVDGGQPQRDVGGEQARAQQQQQGGGVQRQEYAQRFFHAIILISSGAP